MNDEEIMGKINLIIKILNEDSKKHLIEELKTYIKDLREYYEKENSFGKDY
tara:strand:+ start:261 stop:413 length:153 start_codon:yes stop_codon:yes gene_type:complete